MHMTYGGHHTYIHEASHTCSSKVPYIHMYMYLFIYFIRCTLFFDMYYILTGKKIIKSKFFDLFTIHTKSFTLSVKRN